VHAPDSGPTPARGEARWLAAVAAGVLVCWWTRVLLTAKPGPPSFATGDLVGYFLPAYGYVAERLRAGELPWWNPWTGAGVPFVATLQAGALYPARLLLLVLDPVTATHVSLVAHLVLATLATFLLCRRLGAVRWAAVAGAAVFVVPGELPLLYFPPFLEAGAWMPVAGWALARVLAGDGRRFAVLLGAALGLPVLAGGYQTALYLAYATALVGVTELVAGARRLAWTTLLVRLAAAGLIALAIAVPQLGVTIAWTTETTRTTAALTNQQIQPYWHPDLVPALVRSILWQTVTTDGALNTFYLSAPGVLLLLLGAVTGGRRGALAGLWALVFLAICLGPGLPPFVLYHWLPGLDWFRLPQRLNVLVAFFGGVAVALGVTTLARRTPRWVPPLATALVLAALLGPASNPWSLPWTAGAREALGTDVFDAAATLAGPGRLSVPGKAVALGIGVFPRLAFARHVRVLQDYEPLSSRRLRDYLFAMAGTPPTADPAGFTFDGALADATVRHPALLDAAAVTAVVVPDARADAVPPSWHAAAGGLWRNERALPRAYVVTRATPATPETALARMTAPDFDPWREVVVVAGAADLPPTTEATRASAQRIDEDAPERLRIGLDVARPGVLVVADAFAPGWRARVDGVERPLWIANALMRGIRVAPGDRVVDLVYEPPGLRAALLTAAVATVVAVAALLLARRSA
jgi:hypothetical protein